MANLLEDIQCAGSDTRPPMLDRTDFASWQQRIRLYCRGKENGVNILKSIDEGPYQMGTVRETLAESTESAPQFGPERPRVYSDLTSKEKDRYNADIRATNILLQGLPKDIYTLINHYTDAKDIWDNVKMLLERLELTKEDRESQLYDDFEHFRQHKGESIHNYYVWLAINDMRNIKMTMTRLQLNSKFVNNMLLEWGRGQGMNPRGGNVAGFGGAQNRVENVNPDHARPGQARHVKCYNCNGTGHIARNYEAPTARTMFMANLLSADPFTDEAGPSYDSDILSETVRFRNDHFGAIMGYGDYVIGDSVISRVYYVEGLGHNLFSVEQFCDFDLEVAFRKHSCYVRDTDGVELIKGSRGSNLYTISVEDMMKSSLICLLSKSSKNKSWLWHRRLNHLNFGIINDLARKDLVRGLPRLKFEKDHLCLACQLRKSKKHTHIPKTENTNLEVLNTLHMDLWGPIRVQTINGKKYILVIVDDYSQFTWVWFLRLKDDTPEVIIKFITQIQVGLNKTVRYVRTDNGTEFVNHTLTEYYERISIFHQKTVPRIPQQNGVVERWNRTLVEAARTMLIFSKASIFLWAEVVATAYLGKLQPTADTGIFVGYAPSRKGYRIYNKRTRRIMETIHVQFDELTEPMAPVHLGIGPAPNLLTPGQISSGLVPNLVPATPYAPPANKELDILFQPMFDEYLEPP
nr:retrovirus-related Pol polyprotein from transposon TNT 1-94 [Tanacetum cinerariifolium]